MLREITRRKIFTLALIVAICGLLVFLNPSGFFSPLRNIAWSVFSPFQKIAYVSSLKVRDFFSLIRSVGDIKKENEALLKENLKLFAEVAELESLKRQNETLEKQLDLLPRDEYQLENAYVVSYDPRGFENWIQIGKGARNGVASGMPVIVFNGMLVGVVGEVDKNSAQVILVTSPEISVAAVVPKTGAKGIIRGEYGLGVVLDMVPQTEVISRDDPVVTSGNSKNIPPGLLLGKIKEIKPTPDRLFQKATLALLMDFQRLEVVSVIKNVKQ